MRNPTGFFIHRFHRKRTSGLKLFSLLLDVDKFEKSINNCIVRDIARLSQRTEIPPDEVLGCKARVEATGAQNLAVIIASHALLSSIELSVSNISRSICSVQVAAAESHSSRQWWLLRRRSRWWQ
jgi:hypothetical protein